MNIVDEKSCREYSYVIIGILLPKIGQASRTVWRPAN